MSRALARLPQLTTRSSDDPAIALVDAWATVADVLTFYQERIANEGFLRTATERLSILQLARAIGYELNPGVAASTLLAFTVEDSAGAPGRATVETGLEVSSIPGQDERPQTFETVETVEVRATWNVLRPRQTEPQLLTVDTSQLLLRGIGNVLEPGDTLLLVDAERREDADSGRWDARVIRTVEAVPPGADLSRAAYTRVTFTQPLRNVTPSADYDVFVFRQRAALFGHNAPDFRFMPADLKSALARQNTDTNGAEWPGFQIPKDSTQIQLDTIYPRILADSWVVLTGPDGARLYHVDDTSPTARTDFTLSSKVTQLSLDTSTGLSDFGLRETLVLAQSEPLSVADQLAATPVSGSVIVLDQLVDGLHAGQRLILTGRLASDDPNTPLVTENAIVDAVTVDGGRTAVLLVAPLVHAYDPQTLTINANVARATHGETVRAEVLGSGQGGTPNQEFALDTPPLTYVSASTSGGARSTLEVRVDGVRWQDVPSLFGRSSRDQVYTVRIQDDGQTNVIFGDGQMGARLPSGTENVVATYRVGIGPRGNVRPDTLTLLQTRPLGIRSVTNPLEAAGAAAPEDLDDARANAPLTVLTLERVVSLRDFEDFARAFAGVGKAQATQLWNGRAQLAHLTVAGSTGGPVDGLATLPNLQAAIESVRDPVHEVLIQSYTHWSFGIAAEVLVNAAYAADAVLARAVATLGDTFSFARRGFGQSVSAAEIVTAIQAVAGVDAVSLTQLYFVPPVGAASNTPLPQVPAGNPPPFLPAAVARWDGVQARPAELIVIDPRSIALTHMAPSA
jgi:predicted phage baseplate assembly protein